MINKKIFVLLGGLGTRLKELNLNVPKPMVPIEGKPFLWYKLMQLKKRGFKRFVFCTGYLAQIISDFFGDGTKFGVHIEYSIEHEQLGTGGALRHAASFIDGPFFMCNGDCYVDFDPNEMIQIINMKNAKCCMLLTEPQIKGDYGIVTVDNDMRIINFIEKPSKCEANRLINAGVYYFYPEIIHMIESGQKVSIEHDVFPKIVNNKNTPLYGVEYKDYFIDIGIPKNYFQFCEYVKTEKIIFE